MQCQGVKCLHGHALDNLEYNYSISVRGIAGMHAVKGSRRMYSHATKLAIHLMSVCVCVEGVCVCMCVCVEGVYVCEYSDSSPACMHAFQDQIMSQVKHINFQLSPPFNIITKHTIQVHMKLLALYYNSDLL